MITGLATPEGTARFAARFPAAKAGHFRRAIGLSVSSIGLGTYLGDFDEVTDDGYRASIARAFELGLNVLDTAVNYRNQLSERAVGAAIAGAIEGKAVARDEIVVSTKGGFLPLDGPVIRDPKGYLKATYIESGLCPPEELVQGCQCFSPAYIDDQFERSRRNLGLESIDIYYLHNPEMQLGAVDRPAFLSRMRAAMAVLARKVAEGRLGCYGVATWGGLRQPVASASGGLVLDELLDAATEVEGADHHFRAIQLPVSLAMPEAIGTPHDPGRHGQKTVLEVAASKGLYIMGSASLMQARLAERLAPAVAQLCPGLATDAGRALQFARSSGVDTALVGMSQVAHVEDNLAVFGVAELPKGRVAAAMRS